MDEYIIYGETLTAIGDGIRDLNGESDEYSPSDMVSKLAQDSIEIEEQTELINQLQSILIEKGYIEED